MEKQVEKGFVLSILFAVVFLVLFVEVISAEESYYPYQFSVTAGSSSVYTTDGTGSTPTLTTTSTTVELAIGFTTTFSETLNLEKFSDSGLWSGSESITRSGGSWIVSGLSAGNTYYFTSSLYGEDSSSATVYVTVQYSAPTVTASASCDPTTVSLSWTPFPEATSSDEVAYFVYRDDTYLGYVLSTGSYTDTGVSTSTPYTYTVKSYRTVPGVFVCEDATVSITTGACTSTPSPLCGDGLLQTSIGEECDWGSTSVSSCDATCQATPNNGDVCTLEYGEISCDYCSTSCELEANTAGRQYCGDEITQTADGEQCDDGNTVNTDSCTNLCNLPVCGDTIVTSPETCDDGNAVQADSCYNNCTLVPTEQPCSFSTASALWTWTGTTVTEGEVVNMVLSGTTNCGGQGVTFLITPPAGLTTSSTTGTISGTTNSVSAPWVADYVSGGGNVYSFSVKLTSTPTTTKSSSNSLTVYSVSTTSCGDGAIQDPNGDGQGENCDDGNVANSDGCSSSCLTETGYICIGEPSVCEPTSNICGNGLLEPSNGETCDDGNGGSGDGCSSACIIETGYTCVGTAPSVCTLTGCTLTSASWSTAQATEGDVVSLHVQGTSYCNGKTVSFIVLEDDIFSGDDSVTTNPVNVTFSGNTATGNWTAEWQDEGLTEGTDPEYYFTATVSGVGDKKSGLLDVTQSDPGACEAVSVCRDYTDLASCTLDECSVADDDPLSDVDCDVEGISCSCVWDSSTCKAITSSSVGTCKITQSSNDNCDDGFLTFSWTALWTFATGKTAADDTTGLQAKCINGSKTIECPAQIALPFFNMYSLLGALVVIALVYWALSRRKSANKKGSSSKKKRH